MDVNIKELPEYRIAFFRHVGSYINTGENWNKLSKWVEDKELFKTNPLFIGISRDDPVITEEDSCRHRNVFLWLKAHKDNSQTLGYIIQMGALRIVHPGDTDFLPALAKIPLVDVLFIPIGDQALTMGPIEAASLTEAMSPKAVIPMHYEPDTNYLNIFQKNVPDKISIIRFYCKRQLNTPC